MNYSTTAIALAMIISFLAFDNSLNAQVKIGDNPNETPLTSSTILELEQIQP